MGGLRAFAAELIGTFALTLAGAGALCLDFATKGKIGPLAGASVAVLTSPYLIHEENRP